MQSICLVVISASRWSSEVRIHTALQQLSVFRAGLQAIVISAVDFAQMNLKGVRDMYASAQRVDINGHRSPPSSLSC